MKKSLFFRFGSFVGRFRWLLVALWLVVIVGMGSFAPKLGPALSTGGFKVGNSPAVNARQLFKKEFPKQSPNQMMIIHQSSSLKVTDPKFQEHVKKTAQKLEDNSKVKKVITYLQGGKDLIGKNEKTTITIVYLKKKEADKSLEIAPEIVKDARSVKSDDVKTYATGEALIWKEFSDLSETDLARAEMIGLPIAAIALFIAFGSLVAAGIPLLLAMSSLAITFGALFFVTKFIPLNMYVQNIVGMIGLGLGIDYSLLIVSRFREELARNNHVIDAVANTVNTAGRAVLFSGIAVVIAISGLWLINMEVFQHFAIGVSVVAVVVVTAALTFLPAILTILGPKVNWLGFKRLSQSKEGGFWQKWAYLIMKKPATFFVVSLIVILALAFPVLNLKMGGGGMDSMPKQLESKKGFDILKQEFGHGQLALIRIIVKADNDILSSANLKSLRRIEKKIGEEKNVDRVDGVLKVTDALTKSVPAVPGVEPLSLLPSIMEKSPQARDLMANVANIDRNSNYAAITIIPKGSSSSDETLNLVKKFQGKYVKEFKDEGLTAYVGGGTAEDVEFTKEVWRSFPLIFGMVLALTFLVLLFVFRSLVLPLKAVIMNGFSVFAAYGLLVLVFQYGVGDSMLGFKAPGFVGNFTPLFLFCIIFGLSMDYEVFLLSRVKEAYDSSGDNAASVAFGLQKTGRIITSAAFIMITVFGAFALTSLIPIKETGIGMASAIFLDATLVRIILVPATMQLMGDWNWWLPKPLERILPKIKVD